MNWSIKLFTVRGIDIKIHLTFFLILVWAAISWGQSSGAGWQGAIFGVIAMLLLFLSVTLHELGHSFVALKFGVAVKDIVLTPLGGLAQMEEIPENPSQELRMAVAGPLVNVVIAGLLILAGAILKVPALVSPEKFIGSLGDISASGMLAYLTMANLTLAIFNLIPAFPMDGGRVLRSLLAMFMPRTTATRIAAMVGQGLAFAMGFWGFTRGDFVLAFIAVIIWLGAGQEGRDVVVKDALRDVKVRKAMTRDPQVLKSNDSLARAVELTLSSSQSDFPVVEWGTNQVIGVLGENDLLRALQGQDDRIPIREVMRKDIPLVKDDEPVYLALEQMLKSGIKAVPVVDGQGSLVGLLTTSDVNEAFRFFSLEQKLKNSSEKIAD